ncbi:MAG: ABC transporter permease [Candidatus Woesearchaeota archaeon]
MVGFRQKAKEMFSRINHSTLANHPLIKIIAKNYKLLFRSKSSALVIILGPLLLILVVGLAFNNAGNYKIRVGFYFPEYTELTGTILDALEENEFYVELKEDNRSCIESVKSGETNICLIFNKFTVDSSMDNRLNIFVDNSEINLAWLVTDSVSTEVGRVSSNLSTSLSEQLLDRIDVTTNKLTAEKEAVSAMIESQTNLNTKINELETLVKDLDLSMNDIPLSDVKDRSEDVNKHVGFLITRINNNLNRIESRVEDSNISSDLEDNITSLIDDTSDAVKEREKSINDQQDNLSDAVDNLDDSLARLQRKLSNTDSMRNEAIREIEEIVGDLRTNLDNLNNHKKALDGMINTLSGIEIKDARNIAVPINTEVTSIASDQNHLSFMVPTLIVLFIMLIGLFLSSNLVIMEKKSDAFLRNFITPTRTSYFILGVFITAFLLVFLQVLLIFFVTYLLLDLPVPNLFNLLLIVCNASVFFILLGLVVGYIFKTDEAVTLASISIGSGFLLLSGLILPLESMHESIMLIAEYNPLVIAVNVLKQVILFNQSISELWLGHIFLLLYSVLMIAFIGILQIKIKTKELPIQQKK